LAGGQSRGQNDGMSKPPDPHYRHRFPAELINHAVWLYHVFSLSFRDIELLLAERGVIVSYKSVRQWCLKFAASFADKCVGGDPSQVALLQGSASGRSDSRPF
jgi:putative transposase